MALTTVPASLSATALTLTTAAQPNITSVGTLTGLTVSGNIAGTLTTAAQTNITSVGTLTGLSVTGALTGTSATFTDDVAINNGSPEMYFGTTGNHYNWRIAAQEIVDAGFEIAVGSQDTDYSNDTYTQVFNIKNTGNATFSGNVGIGGSPDSDSGLHLKGDGKRILIDSTDENLVSLGRRGSSGAGLDKAYLRMRNAGTNTVVIDTDGATYFNGGNVGVNDNNPDRKVSIIGDNTSGGKYPLSLDATDTDYALEFRRSGTSEWWIKASASNFTVHENGVGDQLGVYSGSVKVFGLLGVNKSANPAVGLSVGADATTTSSYGLEVCNSSANTRFLVDGVGNSYFYKTNNNVGMKYDATNGRLGINHSTPPYPLTVIGEAYVEGLNNKGFSSLGENADGQTDVTTLQGYGVLSGSTRYGRYGVLRFNSSANYTGSSRGYMITNGYGANKFAILQSTSATTMPDIAGAGGGASNGHPIFVSNNSGHITTPRQPSFQVRYPGTTALNGGNGPVALIYNSV